MTACPSPGRWLAAGLRPVPPSERSDLTAHLSGCDTCRRRFDVIRSLGRGPAAPGDAEPETHCVDDTVIDSLASADAPLPPSEALDHVADCGGCLTRLDRRMIAARGPAEDVAPSRRPWWRFW